MALLTLLKEPYRWTVPEGSVEEQLDDEAPLSLLYDPLRPINFADTGSDRQHGTIELSDYRAVGLSIRTRFLICKLPEEKTVD